MAQLAEETVVQRVAALVRGLHRQEGPAVLTRVAILMEVSSHVLDFEGILPVSGDDGILTDAAHRGELPIEVVQAVHLILTVQGKALVPNAPGAGHTREAGGVEGLAQGPDDVFPDNLATLATLLQGVLGQKATASEPARGCAPSKPPGALDQLPTGEVRERCSHSYNRNPNYYP